MKSSDEALEKVLAGLREVEPPAGMEGRVLRATEDRAAAGGFRSRWWAVWMGGVARPIATLALGCGVAAAIALGIGLRPSSSLHRPKRVAGQPQKSPVASPSQPDLGGDVLAQRATNVKPKEISRGSRSGSARVGSFNVRAELRAGDRPAPPLPLTEQERLLLRIAHTGDPVELAALNPELRAQREAQSEAEFEKFFPKPKEIVYEDDL